jgi:L-seryl-tRNA(Ser) seleniumtransferase
MKREVLRRLPAVDSLLRDSSISGFLKENPRGIVVDAIRAVLKGEREGIKRRGDESYTFDIESFRGKVREEMERVGRPSLRRVVNATGVVLHTNLGRDPLAKRAIENLTVVSRGYSNLEFDIEKGERGERYSHLEPILCRITGAPAALVVNNNAAAVLLVLNTIAEGREVIVSRGELVEIGGSFRIPDIMKKSGGRLVEVGTTNRTHLRDYEAAVTPETALILKVHRSNFGIVGFTSDVPVSELMELGRRHGIPVMNDIGSGSLIDLSRFGMKKEPTVQDAVSTGTDIVTFSGDKLLGGPQAGIILGKRELIDKVKGNPLTRAVRIDKLTTAALEATLQIYMDEQKAVHDIPVLRMLTIPISELSRMAKMLHRRLGAIGGFDVRVREGFSMVGGGALPLQEIPSMIVTIKPKGVSPNDLERRMRMNRVPIIARIERDEVVIDTRTLVEGDMEAITDFFSREVGRIE